jgi:integrase
MSDNHSTPSAPSSKPVKPSKPRPDFPLTAHPVGQWCKKIRGKIHYFGPWADPDAALANYLKQKDALHAGQTPRPDTGAATVKDVANAFLIAKQNAVNAGELSPRTWREYKDACDMLVAGLGKTRLVADLRPDDFAKLRKQMAEKWGVLRLANMVQAMRSVFKYAFNAERIDRPVRFGPDFKRPSKKAARLHRAEQGPKLFTAEEVRRMIGVAGMQLRAMILLGINCGMGNADCGRLPLSAVDLQTGAIDFPRPKTGIPRRCALWPETVDAIRAALDCRPEPKRAEHAGLIFLTKGGLSWAKDSPNCPLSREIATLLRKLGINGRKGLGFYTLRHTFRTVADESKDQPAVDFVMGHEVPHMSAVYRETISDERLRAVADHVRKWLFPSATSIRTVE